MPQTAERKWLNNYDIIPYEHRERTCKGKANFTMRSRVASAILFLCCLLAWVLITTSLNSRTTLVDKDTPNIDNTSFQYLEQWGDETKFRWSNRTIFLTMPPTLTPYQIVNLALVGHQPQQPFHIELRHNGTQTIALTTHEQRFRNYQVLFQRSTQWIPALQAPQLIVQTQVKTVENRVLGIGVHTIQIVNVGTLGMAFWWELVWVIFTLFVTSFAISQTWYTLRWAISILACIGLVLAYQRSLAQVYIRIFELSTVGVFLEYRYFPRFMQQSIERTKSWLAFLEHAPDSLGQRLSQQWFVSVGLSGIGVGFLWWARHNDSAEWWDIALYLLVVLVSSISTIWNIVRPMKPDQDVAHMLQKRTIIAIVGVLSGWFFIVFFGFQNELLQPYAIPRFIGFDYWFLLILVIVSVVFPYIIEKSHTTRWGYGITLVVALWICVVSISTIFVANDAFHNTYVVNEILTQVVGRLAYHDFVPQYSTLLNMWVWMVIQWPIITESTDIINISVYGIMLTTIVVAVLLVHIIYQSMERKSVPLAIIFALPTMIMSSFPIWNRIIESTPSADFYSIVPLRLFSIIVPFFVGIHFFEKWNSTIRPHQAWYLGVIIGIIIFNNNDFGFMAAFTLGIIVIFNPYIKHWSARFMSGLYYFVGILSFFFIIISSYSLMGKPFHTEFLFWFSRQFSGGFGALMIAFPGPGTMIITIAVALCVIAGLNIIRTSVNREWLIENPLRMRNYLQFSYFGIIAAISLFYYINRSSARSLGISMIPLAISFYAVWNLIRFNSSAIPTITTSIVRSAALFPVALIFGYTLLPTSIYSPLKYTETIMHERTADVLESPDHTDRLSDWPFDSIKLTATKLSEENLRVGYYGPFAQIAQIYTNVPSTLMFNHPHDMIISNTTKQLICRNVFNNQVEVVIIAEVSIEQNEFCDSYTRYKSPLFPATIAFDPNVFTQQPRRFAELSERLQLCRIEQTGCVSP